MENIQSDEALRVWIINYFSEKLGKHAILKGGMVLRILDCPRYTNDLDYVFVPFKSKKEIVSLIEGALKPLQGITIDYRLHSTNAQFDVILKNSHGVFKTQIEANVSETCESQPLSSIDLAQQYQQAPHIIRVMRFDVMLAHKLAAWNERRLMRDLYDAYFIYKHLNVLPDLKILQERLQSIRYAKRMANKSLPKKMDLQQFLVLLESEAKNLTETELEEELRDYLAPQQWGGLDKKIMIVLIQLVEKIQDMTNL